MMKTNQFSKNVKNVKKNMLFSPRVKNTLFCNGFSMHVTVVLVVFVEIKFDALLYNLTKFDDSTCIFCWKQSRKMCFFLQNAENLFFSHDFSRVNDFTSNSCSKIQFKSSIFSKNQKSLFFSHDFIDLYEFNYNSCSITNMQK